jgi:hypothetical protein
MHNLFVIHFSMNYLSDSGSELARFISIMSPKYLTTEKTVGIVVTTCHTYSQI